MTNAPAEIDLALSIAVRVHADQRDKGGAPYVLHPLRVMLAVGTEDPERAIIGVLHDVVEDGDYTIADLSAAGFSARVTEALALLTRKRGEPYMEYVARLAKNPDARAVKLADLADNLNESRLPGPLTDRDRQRLAKYRRALAWLQAPYTGEAGHEEG